MLKYRATLLLLLFTAAASAKVDKLRIIWNDDPGTTMTIAWDQLSGTSPKVEYFLKSGSRVVMQANPSRSVEYRGMRNVFARLTGLQPGTAYGFRIIDSEGRGEDYWFETAPNNRSERLSFVAGGDSRTFREPRTRANRMVAKLRPHGVIFAGDMVHHDTDEEWKNWFDDWQQTISDDKRMTPIVPARGNHEKRNIVIHKLFDVPSPKIYYDIQFGGGLFQLYTLNTEIRMAGAQSRWLKKSLASHRDATWQVVQYHRPVRPHLARKHEGDDQYKFWVPLFEAGGVKLAIECDSHTHKITWPIRKSDGDGSAEGFVRDDAKGIVYVGEGCWGAPLQNNDDNKPWTRDSGRVNSFKWIFVDEGKIEIRTVEYDNSDEVESVAKDDRFSPPANIKLRVMGDSDVATILP